MKLDVGSLQRKGRRWYLTVRQSGKLKWVALKTENARLAAIRARQLLGVSAGSLAWLHHLAKIGRQAEGSIRTGSVTGACTWQNLHEHFAALSGENQTAGAYADHGRYLRHLARLAAPRPPQGLTSDDARDLAGRLGRRYLSADRMVRFFRRVWQALNWDESVWSAAVPVAAAARRRREFYRRLTTPEVVQVVVELRSAAGDNPLYAELADMVVIGYYTGLRLSDVAELETGEVDASGNFLKIVPNKTRCKKRRPLTVPLVREARAIVVRRRTAAPKGYLFSADARRRPSRKISAGFRQAKIDRIGEGRASFHSLRATFISQMDEAGIPPHVTDSITGHGGGGMHARYTQPSAQAQFDAVMRGIVPLFA